MNEVFHNHVVDVVVCVVDNDYVDFCLDNNDDDHGHRCDLLCSNLFHCNSFQLLHCDNLLGCCNFRPIVDQHCNYKSYKKSSYTNFGTKKFIQKMENSSYDCDMIMQLINETVI